jgi:hypothetical protein
VTGENRLVFGREATLLASRVDCAANIAVVDRNPIDHLKIFYGRGHGFYGLVSPSDQWKHGGVAWTIKDSVVFPAQALLGEAEWYVQQERTRLTARAAGTGS